MAYRTRRSLGVVGKLITILPAAKKNAAVSRELWMHQNTQRALSAVCNPRATHPKRFGRHVRTGTASLDE